MNYKFNFNGQRHIVYMLSVYRGTCDIRVPGNGGFWRASFNGELGREYPKGSIQRTAYAAFKRARHNEFRDWAVKNGFRNVGTAMRFIA